jgi:Leucine-rich repeat (LRR) protein
LSAKLIFNAPFVYGDLVQTDGTDTITLTGAALAEITEIDVNTLNVLEIEGLVFCTSLTILYCGRNSLTALPALPDTLQYLDCYNNSLTELPALPDTLTILYCDTNLLTALPALPDALTILYCYNNSLTALPALPDALIDLYCYNNLLTSAEMDAIAVELDTAGLSDGYYVWSPQTNLQEPNQTAAAYLSLISKG